MSSKQPQQNDQAANSRPGDAIFNKAALESLSPFGQAEFHPTDTTIASRGQTGETFYIVLSGQLQVSLQQEHRRLPLAPNPLRLERPRHLSNLIDFNFIAGLNIVIVLNTDTTFGTVANFINVVFKAPQ